MKLSNGQYYAKKWDRMQKKTLEPLPIMQGNFDVKYDMKDGWKPMDPRERAALR